MPANAIVLRVFAFLREHPPFFLLDKERLMDLSGQVQVRFFRQGQQLFQAGQAIEPFLFVVREGAVHLVGPEGEGRPLADVCGEGDVFGLQTLRPDTTYPHIAEAAEDSLLYLVPAGPLRDALPGQPALARFVATALRSEGQAVPDAEGDGGYVSGNRNPAAGSLLETQRIPASRAPVTCGPATRIRDAAERMVSEGVGSIVVVDPEGRPLGIVTDQDLRRTVATGRHAIDEAIAGIMSAPVITAPPAPSAAEVVMHMMEHRIRHLCLTEDGSPETPLVGVLSERDMLALQGNDPVILLKEARGAPDGQALGRIRDRAEAMLGRYLQQEVSVHYLARILTRITDALWKRALTLTADRLAAPPEGLRFCWLAIGSLGRGEQLLRTDQDTALLFAGPTDAAGRASARTWLLTLAEGATAMLKEAGYPPCPAGMMARNPAHCLSLAEWEDRFGDWIRQPTPKAVMTSCIFFDFRSIFGDATLASTLEERLADQLRGQDLFLAHLARQAQNQPPPLTFFRRFVVESSGEHRDRFDIKARALAPLSDIARVLALDQGLLCVKNTAARYRTLADREPQNAPLFRAAAEAFALFLRLRSREGLAQDDDGRYIDPARLSTMERLQLRNAFRPIRQLQRLLGTRFQTAFFT